MTTRTSESDNAAVRDRAGSVAILSIGDELAIGQSLDTNSKWLSERLTDIGLSVVEHVTVPDDLGLMVQTLRRLGSRCASVVITGGLGPTADDLTREALATLAGEPLIEDPEGVRAIEAWFASARRAMPERNRVQALRPASGSLIPNANGTAPGIHLRCHPTPAAPSGPTDYFALPGPPGEMHPMFDGYVLAHIARPAGRTVRTRVMHTVGLGESDVAKLLGELMDRDRTPLVGTTASGGIVSVRIRYEGSAPSADIDAIVASTVADVMARVGHIVFSQDGRPLPEILLDRLRERGERVAVVESCTGGMLGAAITAIPGSSDVVSGGWITYSNEMKSAQVGVPGSLIDAHGAVSREVAEAMAVGGLDRSGAAHALAITGVAGPGGGSDTKPVGAVWICRASRRSGAAPELDARRFLMRGGRDAVRQWSVVSAMAMLEMHLRGSNASKLLRQQEP